MPVPETRQVHGDDLLYRFFRDLFIEDPAQGAVLASRLIEATAIWLPLALYEAEPVMLPWVVRDPTCRGNKDRGVPDEWSSPNPSGYLRDDNSLVKAIPRSLSVTGPLGSALKGARMGREFVASHVWRVVQDNQLASRLPLLNTFVPNLVWLPSQVAKLSDQEGSVLQRALQSMSYMIYRESPVAPQLADIAEEAWALLPKPAAIHDIDTLRLNWFLDTARSRRFRAKRLATVVGAFDSLASGGLVQGKIVSSRYTAGIVNLPVSTCSAMTEHLHRFVAV